ncbi:alkaline shock response membrane anchor protein AmaP [Nesterenkonia sandarakina]|uniref:Uncharacterized protein n=1 Tax=Nesterenkonia sandarakina TaxID=272918 RepID=A0A7Z0E6U9_9MICC|nr:alkaline shock response membrane anchor protein AmaP [Nesterenkonia sandarakina]NYJ16152.1 hypothetical protein [Nesterenkonia sandarakina]
MIAVSKAPNRAILFLLGLVLLLASAAVLATALGLLSQLFGSWDQAPGPKDALGAADALPAWLPAAALTVSALLVLLGLWWILTAVPRSERAGEFQLHTDGREGVTRLNTTVLQRAIAESAEAVPGVVSSTVRLEGTAKAPGLLMKVEIDERSDVRAAVERIHRDTCGELEQSLQAQLSAVRLIVDPVRHSSRSRDAEVEMASGAGGGNPLH